jgi:hypothetical protein
MSRLLNKNWQATNDIGLPGKDGLVTMYETS